MFKKLPSAVHMVKDAIVIYRMHQTFLILISWKRFISYPEIQYLSKVVLNFKEAL